MLDVKRALDKAIADLQIYQDRGRLAIEKEAKATSAPKSPTEARPPATPEKK